MSDDVFDKLVALCPVTTFLGARGLKLDDLNWRGGQIRVIGNLIALPSTSLDHARIEITLDTYSHVLPWLQEAAAGVLDERLASG